MKGVYEEPSLWGLGNERIAIEAKGLTVLGICSYRAMHNSEVWMITQTKMKPLAGRNG